MDIVMDGPWGPREPRSNALIVAAFLGGALFWWAVTGLGCKAKAAEQPPYELVAVAREVRNLPAGPTPYGRDCVWRTSEVLKRLAQRKIYAHRFNVGFERNCHQVAATAAGRHSEWLIDGQRGTVVLYEFGNDRPGPYLIDDCAGFYARLGA